ncbi:MAG TPA: TonB-dependent receptor [Polyangiaceae bacterium]|nr:TonB-dependent receptor [Polyangiaceae bacterium]
MILGFLAGTWCALHAAAARAEPGDRAAESAPTPSQVAAPELTPPRVLSDTRVAYPEGATGNAEVVLELVIDRDGAVKQARPASGDEPFSSAALAAAHGFRFEPARRGDRPVSARVRLLVTFVQEEIPDSAESTAAAPEQRAPGAAAPEPASQPIEVTVEGERKPLSRKLSRAEARLLPGAFSNPFNAIESLPGVTPTLSGAPYFYVRGSPPGNLGLFLDGIRLPSLFHVFAGPSVIHPALVESVDFYPGPYPARYGRFAGGIAAGSVRPASYALHGEANVRAFDSSALLELPLSDQSSLTLSGRKSYANYIAHLFAPDISVDYWDYQARFETRLSRSGRLTLFSFGARDLLQERRDDATVGLIDSAFHRVLVRYEYETTQGRVAFGTVLGSDQAKLDEGRVALRDTSVELFVEGHRRLDSLTRLDAGLDAVTGRYRTRLGHFDDLESRADYAKQFPTRVDRVVGGYLSLERDVTRRLHATLGLRSDLYASGHDTALAVEPRLSSELQVTPHVALLSGFGVAHQTPGNVLPLPGATPALQEGLQVAYQSSAGVRLSLPSDLTVEATLFQSALFNLSDAPGVSRLDNGDDTVDELSRSLGSSRGLELSLRRSLTRKLGGYLSYTLSRTQRSLGRVTGPALFDRRHVLSGAVAYAFSRDVHFGLRGSFYTGIPADVAYVEAARAPPRTSPYYRIDVRGERRFRIGTNGAYVAIVLEMLNTTLSEEALGKSCNAYVCREDTVGPVAIPSAGLEAVF